jgi:hypothetical protein
MPFQAISSSSFWRVPSLTRWRKSFSSYWIRFSAAFAERSWLWPMPLAGCASQVFRFRCWARSVSRCYLDLISGSDRFKYPSRVNLVER